MTDFGVVPEGFRLKLLDDILTSLREAQEAAFGPSINTQADSVLGQLNAIYGDEIAQAWLVAQSIYRSAYPDSASAEALENVGAITGTVRLPATPSTATLRLNLEDGTTIPVGSVASVGASGARWVTTEEVENSSGDPDAAVEVSVESEETGIIVGNAYAIDNISTPITGWSAKAATDSAVGSGTRELVDGQTLLVSVDEGDDQTITFSTVDFVDIAAATLAEIVQVINDQLDDGTAVEGSSFIHLESNTDGPGSAIQITGGTANVALGFSYEPRRGMNWSSSAQIDSAATAPFALVDGQSLAITVDDTLRTVTFATGDFVDIANATPLEVCASINDQIGAYAQAYVIGVGALAVRIESLTRGNNSAISVAASAAATALGFVTGTTYAGVSGDAAAGRDLENDADYRVRREELLRLSGAATVEAIRSAVRALDNVEQAFVFENDTDTIDINGLPPHSIEVVVSNGDNTEIAEEIFAVKAAGIQTYRDPGAAGRTVTVTDSQGFTYDINFTRPTDVDMYIEADISVDSDEFGGGVQATGEQAIKDAITALGDTFIIGQDIVINKILAAIMDVTGVTDVTALKVDDVDPPVNTANMAIAAREFALFADVRIVLNIS